MQKIDGILFDQDDGARLIEGWGGTPPLFR
jgi:hypothetical protein